MATILREQITSLADALDKSNELNVKLTEQIDIHKAKITGLRQSNADLKRDKGDLSEVKKESTEKEYRLNQEGDVLTSRIQALEIELEARNLQMESWLEIDKDRDLFLNTGIRLLFPHLLNVDLEDIGALEAEDRLLLGLTGKLK